LAELVLTEVVAALEPEMDIPIADGLVVPIGAFDAPPNGAFFIFNILNLNY
jgi:hypothetical protein